jgi:hypothetical protein
LVPSKATNRSRVAFSAKPGIADSAVASGRHPIAAVGRIAAPDKRWFSVWFERVYEKRDGKWIYLSHRTVHGPKFGADRRSVRDK